METRAHHVLIGLFVVILSAGALLLALALSRPDSNLSYTYYKVIFNEAVSGLSRGSAVQYSGIKVGDVSELALDEKDPSKVLARIRVEGRIPIKTDTRAILAVTGITGVAAIQLSGGTPDSPRLVGEDGEDPVIIASRSPLSRLFEGGGDMMSNLNELVLNAKQILTPENSASIRRTLANVESLTGSLAQPDGQVSTLMKELTQAGRDAQTTLQSTNALIGSADRLLTDQGGAMLTSARKAMVSLERTSAQVERLLGANRGALNNGMQGLNELGPALQQLRGALAAIRAIAGQLQENPSAYLLGQKTIKEFQP